MGKSSAVSVLGRGWEQLLALVPPRHRGKAMELAMVMHGEYAAGEALADAQGYSRGFTAGADARSADGERGYSEGWDRGFKHAVDDVLARTGVPALYRFDGDPLTGPPQLPES